ncbi:anti-sigma-I factor RsgI8-like [Penaeus japonicus]|uniref:anti-sigma-I factor RsgI8-like n=1 Tax=Penaeus japonicus TaxID=27405 RepID=UPI001C70C708|nr:anti-sigma-I factor RsgI8-like [Penaeus japonicus]
MAVGGNGVSTETGGPSPSDLRREPSPKARRIEYEVMTEANCDNVKKTSGAQPKPTESSPNWTEPAQPEPTESSPNWTEPAQPKPAQPDASRLSLSQPKPARSDDDPAGETRHNDDHKSYTG